MLAKSQSHIDIDNVTFTNNGASFCFFNISGKSKLEMYNALFLQNNRFRGIFSPNKMYLLDVQSSSRAIIQNNTLTENKFSVAYRIMEDSSAQLNHVVFTRNTCWFRLLFIESNSSAIIQNNTLIENFVSLHLSFFGTYREAYLIRKNSSIQLNHIVFSRNNFYDYLLYMKLNSSAITQNNTLIENNVSWYAYSIYKSSSIQFNNVAFTRNKFKTTLLAIWSYSNATIQNNTLTENNLKTEAYSVSDNSMIQLINVTFIRNVLQRNLLSMVSNSSAKLINNRMVGNSFHRMFLAQSSDLEIDNTFFQLIRVVTCRVSFELMKIRENNVEYDMIYAENSAGRITNTYIGNSDKFLISAFRTTCMYLGVGNSNFLFEITNTEIIWSSEVRPLARPIIQLCGKVSLSNVKLLVTSLFETEILQYSNKDVLLSEYGNFKNLANDYKFSSLFIRCTKASVKHIAKADTFRCIPCARGT